MPGKGSLKMSTAIIATTLSWHFETLDVGDEIEYTILELDLYKADATNFMPDQFQFPDISS